MYAQKDFKRFLSNVLLVDQNFIPKPMGMDGENGGIIHLGGGSGGCDCDCDSWLDRWRR